MMEKCYKFRIYPNAEQVSLIQRTFGCCRFVYNHFLNERIEQYKTDKATLTYNKCSAVLTSLKCDLEWLKEVDSTSLQSSLKDLDTAYQNFFRGVKQGGKIGFPRFKSKKNNRKSFTGKCVNGNIAVTDTEIKLPKLGLVKCTVSKQVQGRILSATVSQNPSGKYFVSLCCTDVDIPQYEATNSMIGIDLGLKEFAIDSNGNTYTNHKYLAKSTRKLAKAQRRLQRHQDGDRKTIGSNNRNKARVKVARLHEKIANQRNDTLHKLSTQFVKDHDVICVEGLQVRNMVRNHKLAKSISDVSWSEFVRQLQYKCEWQHKTLVRIDKFYPSSQLCSVCGYRNSDTKNLAVRSWKCPNCGTEHDRDVNAAVNILNEGLRLLKA